MRCGDPACLPGIDVSLDVFFRDPRSRGETTERIPPRHQERHSSSSSSTLVVPARHNDAFSQAITRTAVMCIACTPTRTYRNNNKTTDLGREREKERQGTCAKERRERATYIHSFSLEATSREQSPELPRSLRRSARSLGEIDKGLRRFCREIARFSK